MIKNYRNGEQIGGCEGLETALKWERIKIKLVIVIKRTAQEILAVLELFFIWVVVVET